MIDYFDDISVCAYWHDRPLTAGDAFDSMKAFLHQLQGRGGPFSSWCLMQKEGYVPLDTDLGNLRDALVKHRNPDVLYTNADPADGSFSLSSYSWAGYRSGFTNSWRDKDRTVIITIACGKNERFDFRKTAPNSVVFRTSPEIETPTLLRSLLSEVVSFWQPNDAVVTDSRVMRRLGPSLDTVSTAEVEIGWLTYFADARVRHFVPDGYPIEAVGNGLIVKAAAQPGAADDETYVARLVRLRDALRPHGMLDRRQSTETS